MARAMFYMDIRYEGGVHGITNAPEPDLRLTNDPSLIVSTGGNAPVGYMGILDTLLQWHAQDPVTPAEVVRNEVIFSFQGNRNPFIDHPEWVGCIYQNVGCGGPLPDNIFADQFED
ncbi:MAG: endonuclease, partial [Xanthomonadales bacterium]|nr:endonuclease [Xanthomonadales bacterium]